MAATIVKGYTFGSTEQVTSTKLHSLIDSATISGIVNAEIAASAGIVDTKLATISTAGKVVGDALNTLENIPSSAGVIPSANVTTALVKAVPADVVATGLTITLKAHANVAFGDVCFINSDGEAQIADASVIATSSGIVMAVATIAANASGTFLLNGVARNDAWGWTVGGLIYLTITGTTTNTMSQTAPTGTDEVIQILGVATHADRMYFNPQLIQVEHT